jgi:DNA-directed RNA polymerase specialized sigma24 family protein
MTNASRRQHGFGIVGALDQEWRELVGMHPEAVMGWAVRHAALAPCQSLDDVLFAAKHSPDAVLAALLAEVSAGDRLAGRVVLQALVGRIARMAQRDPRSGIDDYLVALWQVINNYPLARRPVRILANLSMDTLQAVTRERSWVGRSGLRLCPSIELLEELLEPAGLDGRPIDSAPLVELEARRVLEVSSLLCLIEKPDAALLTSIYADGLTGAQAARRFHISASNVRVRCSRAVRRLAAHAVELTDVA